MARSIRAPKAAEPVYTWAFRSSQPRGGTFITYETRLEETGSLRCNCPGWIFCRGTKECKHTKLVDGEVKEILRKFKAGEALPTLEDPDSRNTHTGFGAAATPQEAVRSGAPKAGKNDKVKFGRLIEI